MLVAVPPAAILAGVAAETWTRGKGTTRGFLLGLIAAAGIAVPLPLFYAQEPITLSIAARVKELCPGPIIHWTNNPSHFVHLQFLANRIGWTVSEMDLGQLERFRRLGANCLVVTLREHQPHSQQTVLPGWIAGVLPYYYTQRGTLTAETSDLLDSLRNRSLLRFLEVRRQEPHFLATLMGRLVPALVPPTITHTVLILGLQPNTEDFVRQ